jgi:hypothetical protein
MTTNLFRPVGLHELALTWDTGMREFPPRLPHQPIFYPVTNEEYARQIARDWNTKDEKSGFAGFVTAFSVQTDYPPEFEPHIVGSSQHQELWAPSEELTSSNKAIVGRIELEDAFFGPHFLSKVFILDTT